MCSVCMNFSFIAELRWRLFPRVLSYAEYHRTFPGFIIILVVTSGSWELLANLAEMKTGCLRNALGSLWVLEILSALFPLQLH